MEWKRIKGGLKMQGYIKGEIERFILYNKDNELRANRKKDWEEAYEEFCENILEE